MTKKILYPILPLLAILLSATLSSSCENNKGNQPLESGELTLSGLSPDRWTYFSFEKGDAVGSSTFRNAAADEAWSKRSDWDFAICGDYIKTNSGTSGKGKGGIQMNTTTNFLLLETAPEEGYLTDEILNVR